MHVRVEAELLDQALAAFGDGGVDNLPDGGVRDAVLDGPVAFQIAKVRADGVAAVEGEELPLQIGHQVVRESEARDVRLLALPGGGFHVPLTVALYGGVQDVLKAGLGADAVHGAVGKADMLLQEGGLLLAQVLHHLVFQAGGGPQAVLAADHVHGLRVPGLDAGLNAPRDGLGDDGQDVGAHGGGDEGALGHLPGELRGGGDYAVHIADGNFAGLLVQNVNRVAVVPVQRLDDGLHHVGKGDMPARLAEQGPDEPPADVARADLNCLFHSAPP